MKTIRLRIACLTPSLRIASEHFLQVVLGLVLQGRMQHLDTQVWGPFEEGETDPIGIDEAAPDDGVIMSPKSDYIENRYYKMHQYIYMFKIVLLRLTFSVQRT